MSKFQTGDRVRVVKWPFDHETYNLPADLDPVGQEGYVIAPDLMYPTVLFEGIPTSDGDHLDTWPMHPDEIEKV